MAFVHERTAPVIYVAGSARELPVEVQDWLSRAETHAVAAPHIYDLLAQLARGKKFAAVIVSIQSVDWNEMDFFDYAARLSRHTPLYVAGPPPQHAKMEAACRRGARLFDAVSLREEALQTDGRLPARQSRSGDERPAQADSPSDSSPPRTMPVGSHSPWTVPSIRLKEGLEKPADTGPVAGTAEAESKHIERAQNSDEQSPDRPAGTADSSSDAAESKSSESAAGPPQGQVVPPEPSPSRDDSGAPVVFPWSQNADRPKRTPPGGTPPPTSAEDAPNEPLPHQPPQNTEVPPDEADPSHADGHLPPKDPGGPDTDGAGGAGSAAERVHLTPEEIAALMAPPSRRPDSEASS